MVITGSALGVKSAPEPDMEEPEEGEGRRKKKGVKKQIIINNLNRIIKRWKEEN